MEDGNYYIETDDFVLFRGHGVYSRPIIEYVLHENIITMKNIKYQFKSSNIVPYHFFQPFLKYVWELFDRTDKRKLSINSFVGILGRRKRTFIESSFSLSTDTNKIGEVYQQFHNPYKNEFDNIVCITNEVPIQS
jgi:hypothetical protein